MAVKENKVEAAVEVEALEPGFYVNGNGPYATEEDAQAFIDGHMGGKGTVREVIAND